MVTSKTNETLGTYQIREKEGILGDLVDHINRKRLFYLLIVTSVVLIGLVGLYGINELIEWYSNVMAGLSHPSYMMY